MRGAEYPEFKSLMQDGLHLHLCLCVRLYVMIHGSSWDRIRDRAVP